VSSATKVGPVIPVKFETQVCARLTSGAQSTVSSRMATAEKPAILRFGISSEASCPGLAEADRREFISGGGALTEVFERAEAGGID
jgi:hypothetical protein